MQAIKKRVPKTKFANIPLSRIVPGTNVRAHVNGDGALAASYKELGVINPVTVRRIGPDKFELISGGRRFAAAKKAGLKAIPCIIRTADNRQRLLEQIVENVQRENLPGLDESEALHRYLALTGESRLQLANRLGKSEAYLSRVLAITKNLTAEEKQDLRALGDDQPAKETLILAAQTRDPKTRASMLSGDISSAEAAEMHRGDVKRGQRGRPKHRTWGFTLPDAKVDIRFRTATPTKALCFKVLAQVRQAASER